MMKVSEGTALLYAYITVAVMSKVADYNHDPVKHLSLLKILLLITKRLFVVTLRPLNSMHSQCYFAISHSSIVFV